MFIFKVGINFVIPLSEGIVASDFQRAVSARAHYDDVNKLESPPTTLIRPKVKRASTEVQRRCPWMQQLSKEASLANPSRSGDVESFPP